MAIVNGSEAGLTLAGSDLSVAGSEACWEGEEERGEKKKEE
jgi:hypothetical protein